MGLFAIVPVIVLLGFVLVGSLLVATVVRVLRQRAHDNAQPVQTLRATVVTKRSHTSGGGDTSAVTSYYATFELPDGQRSELRVSGAQYGQLAEGDRGMLTRQGSRFQGFGRELPEAPQ